MDKRTLTLRNPDGSAIHQIDISDIDNANTLCPIYLEVETRCDMGHWHTNSIYTIPPFGRAIKEEDR